MIEPPLFFNFLNTGFIFRNGSKPLSINPDNINVPEEGFHTLKVLMIDPGVAIEKIIINTSGLKPSHIGPKESYFKQ